jgi:aromatic ring-opening dioxygenase LigB subunit
MVLVGAAILPHASMILDPTLEDIPPGIDELHSAAKYVGDVIRDHEPDVIVLATPHGLNLSDSIGIYANHVASGSAEWNGEWGDYRVSINVHDQFAIEMFNHLQVSKCNNVPTPSARYNISYVSEKAH